jgi:hypothetical protein
VCGLPDVPRLLADAQGHLGLLEQAGRVGAREAGGIMSHSLDA